MRHATRAHSCLVTGQPAILHVPAPQFDAAELITTSNGHEQVRQASIAWGGADGLHGLEMDVVMRHQLPRHQGLQGKTILISLHLLGGTQIALQGPSRLPETLGQCATFVPEYMGCHVCQPQ